MAASFLSKADWESWDVSIVNKHWFVPLWPLSSIHWCHNIIIIRKGASTVLWPCFCASESTYAEHRECICTKWSNILLSALLLGYRAGDWTPKWWNANQRYTTTMAMDIAQVHFALANSNISYYTIIAGRLLWHSTAHNRCWITTRLSFEEGVY